MTDLLLGLTVALGGALLLAAGSELQSRAVHTAGGRPGDVVRNRRWQLGLALLGTAILTNFIALSLAPVSVVQAMSIVALAASTGFGMWAGRITMTRPAHLSLLACVLGIAGFVSVIATHPGESPADPAGRLPAVTSILAGLTLAAAVAAVFGRVGRAARFAGLVVGAMTFSSITTVFKVLVELVGRDGFAATLSRPTSLIALVLVLAGGTLANLHLQRSHRDLPPPSVVAAVSIVDTITATGIGIVVLGESTLPPYATVQLVLFGAAAALGVIGLGRLRRTPAARHVPTTHHRMTGIAHAHRLLQ